MGDITVKIEPKVIIGSDTVNRVASLSGTYGGRVLLVTEQALYDNRMIDRVKKIFEDAGLEVLLFDEVPSQATAEVAETIAELARGARCDVIVGYGGIKTQAISRLASMLVSGTEYLFDLLDGKESSEPSLPFIAVPTTGREPFLFSEYFIAIDPRDRCVRYIKASKAQAKAVIIDPALSENLSAKFAATTLFDGLGVAIEAYCSSKSSFISDALAERSIALYAESMDAFANQHSLDLLEKSTHAGFLGSLAASLSAPGIGTALSYAINAKYPVAKSWCSTVLLPYIMENLLPARPEKMAQVAALFGEAVEGAGTSAAAEVAVDAVRRRMGILEVPARLKDFGLDLDRMVSLSENARGLEFVAFSPRPLSNDDAFNLLKQAF